MGHDLISPANSMCLMLLVSQWDVSAEAFTSNDPHNTDVYV